MNPRQQKYPMTWEQSVDWLRTYGDPRLVKACYFDDPVEEAAKRYYEESEWQEIRKFMPSQKNKVLDVGSGRGIAAYALARDGWQVTALEPDPSDLVGAGAIKKLASITNLNINVVSDWGEKLPFSNNSFSAIHARQVLHHSRDLNLFCREIFRVCEPGGLLIATREHIIDGPEDLKVFLKSHPLHHLYGGEHAYQLHEYIIALKEAGFAIEQVLSPFETPINYFPSTKNEIRQIVWRSLVGKRISRIFPISLPWIFVKIFSQKYLKTPGRLYTFVVRKPQTESKP